SGPWSARSGAQVVGKELEHLAPAVHRLLLAVERRVVVEEPVSGAVVAVELVVLALLLQFLLVNVDSLGGWALVVVPEQPEDRRVERGGVVDRRNRTGGRQLIRCGNHATTPK